MDIFWITNTKEATSENDCKLLFDWSWESTSVDKQFITD